MDSYRDCGGDLPGLFDRDFDGDLMGLLKGDLLGLFEGDWDGDKLWPFDFKGDFRW
jgi:hypothetical protein